MHKFAGASVLVAFPSLALAHEGVHGGSFFAGLGHTLTEPDHLAMMLALAAAVGAGFALRKILRKRKARKGVLSAARQE
ncbi:HupE/UreJ family protein [Marinobacterium litorale]|uniref:HupE/UreJ family protein n=1 Tax=Marinobacterium litorale TaxID=404770 RepID=UPI00040F4DC8|nr:HupE/UreJ family protein [Marinobacterium litorale]